MDLGALDIVIGPSGVAFQQTRQKGATLLNGRNSRAGNVWDVQVELGRKALDWDVD